MAVRNLQDFVPTIWVPPGGTPTYAITITRLDGTVDDVTDLAQSWFFEDGATEIIGSFELDIPNPNETYTSLYTGMEVVRYYKDYDVTASTPRFQGRVEKPSNNNNKLTLTGRSETLFAFEQSVNQQYGSLDLGQLIYQLFNTYGQGKYDLSQINQGTGIIIPPVDFAQQPFWDCVKSVVKQGNYDCYVDATAVVRLFLHGSIQNTTDAIVHDSNLVMVGDFLPDTTQVKNKVVYMGADQNGYQPIQTASDLTSQSRYGIRPLIQQDNNTLIDASALANAQATLAVNLVPPRVGEVKCLLLATIQPGDALQISAPMDGLNQAYYNTVSYKDELNDQGLFTTVRIEREPRRITHLISDLSTSASQLSSSTSNPANMSSSYGFTFDDSVGTFSGTVISNGVVSLTGAPGGTWVSPSTTTTANVSQVYVNASGQTLTSLVIEVSADGGITYETITLNTLHTMSTSVGSTLRARLTLNDATTQVDSLNILYNVAT